MADIFHVDADGCPRKLERAPCRSEERELQLALKKTMTFFQATRSIRKALDDGFWFRGKCPCLILARA